MKRKFNLLPCAAFALALMFSACSHDDEPTPNNAPLISLGGDATFTLTEEKFETSKPASMPASRAMAAQAQPQEVDLGDGLHATMSIEEDSQPETRANPISQGRYSIYALDGSGNRITGTHKTLTGEVNASGKFVPDAGSRLDLPAGTYTFVCISEGVTDNGTSLSITNSTKNPMLGKVTKTISSTDRHVSFEMKHLAARVRCKLVVYTEAVNNVSIVLKTLNDPALNLTPLTTTYDVKGDKTGFTPGNTQTDPITHTGALTEKDATYVLAHHFYTSYYYIQPGTTNNQVSVSFTGGELYDGMDMTSKRGTVFKTTPITFAANKSYTLVMKLRPLLYLFNDGTNGVLSEKGSRTPIGIVTKEKTKNHEGTAAGLKVSPMALKWEMGGSGQQRNTTVHNTWWDMPTKTGTGAELNGYDLTWTGSGTTDGKKRAEEQTQYPAFYWAGNYQPGVATSNIGKWYIPALGEIRSERDLGNQFDHFLAQFSPGNGANWGVWNDGGVSYNASFAIESEDRAKALFKAFTDAGSALPDDVCLWTTSTCDGSYNFRPIYIKFSVSAYAPHPMGGWNVARAGILDKDAPDVYVWPYVHF
ncbi:hypothetical protein J5A66_01325 [Prevotella sp. oral taxon 475]|uniref:fimbrillin family protein n=1 Tax=Prevotella sp. oral taxon 475 TaxID=712471 RepID=UPI001BA75ECA|nr:fimbrillin family protein [Prevotella sp. oral taxon 475]QUB47501.1 hypothetical protein J5A66_01325 [Prevotella sp. oral taxon 475]